MCASGDKPAGWSVKKTVRVEQEGGSTVPPVPNKPERGQSSVQGVHKDERRLPQLHSEKITVPVQKTFETSF